MRVLTILLAFLELALAAAILAANAGESPTALTPYAAMAPWAVLGVALLLIVVLLVPRAEPTPVQKIAEPATPMPITPIAVAPTAKQAEAEVVSFLALLQEKGRLVDFLMDDIAGYSDAQVGAAGRVLHEGCKAVLREHFAIVPLREESEGAKVTVPAGYAPGDYRLVGRIGGEAPFTGALVHHGWKTQWVKLPRLVATGADRLPAIAPAEVELG